MEKQTAVEWLSNQAYELFEQYSEGRFNRNILNKLMLQATEEAKKIEKNNIITGINDVSKKNIQYANNIINAFTKIEGELFMYDDKQAIEYYNNIYKKNEEDVDTNND